ncbi:MAG: hypothetical protein AB7P20_24375 [Rhizobiaceae bacterium]
MDGILVARTLHILAVVIWIGGLAMATTVAIPAVRTGDLGADWQRAFHAIERRFVWQARTTVLIVGATGFYMTAELDLWDRFSEGAYWWMHGMVCVWVLFVLILFAGEPLVLHRSFERWAAASPRTAFSWLQRAHWLLLAVSLLTVFGAAAGSHGWFLY